VASTRAPPPLWSWCQGLYRQQLPRPVARTQRICWFVPMIIRFNPTWPFLATLHKVCSAQHTAQRTPRAPSEKWSLAQLSKQKIWWLLVKSVIQQRQLWHEANSGHFDLHKIH
jgi:hypothetical protein